MKYMNTLRKSMQIGFVSIFITICFSFSIERQKERVVLLQTNYGSLKVKLYNQTPQHRDNFLKLVESKYYDSLLIHRVIPNFMIQAGDPNSRNARPKQMLGMGGPGYTISAEFVPGLIHKKGAVAAARFGDNQNPTKASSGSQFYIVQGRKISIEELAAIEEQRIENMTFAIIRDYLLQEEQADLLKEVIALEKKKNMQEYATKIEDIKRLLVSQLKELDKYRYTVEQKEIYTKIGGTPHLDYEYTVFGEVIEGMDVVEKISAVETKDERPRIDVVMKMKVVK